MSTTTHPGENSSPVLDPAAVYPWCPAWCRGLCGGADHTWWAGVVVPARWFVNAASRESEGGSVWASCRTMHGDVVKVTLTVTGDGITSITFTPENAVMLRDALNAALKQLEEASS